MAGKHEKAVMARNGWTSVDIAGIGWNGWIYLEVTENDWK